MRSPWGPFDPDKGVPAAKVAALLNRLINLKTEDDNEYGALPKGWSVERAFYLPKLVRRGVPFHNMPRDDLDYKRDPAMFARVSPLWPRCTIGFLSADALCVVIPKLDAVPAYVGVMPLDANWLRDNLVGKDGKPPLHKPLIEKPWPRGK